MTQPSTRLCKCGTPLKTATDRQCEDCDVNATQRWNGKSQRVNTNTVHDDKLPEAKTQ
jgi:NMD protein affecting ribosome stability and mRNA decay